MKRLLITLTLALLTTTTQAASLEANKATLKAEVKNYIELQHNDVKPKMTEMFFMFHSFVDYMSPTSQKSWRILGEICGKWRGVRQVKIDRPRTKVDNLATKLGLDEWRADLFTELRTQNCYTAPGYDLWSKIDRLCPLVQKQNLDGLKNVFPLITKKFSKSYMESTYKREACTQVLTNFN